MTKSSAGVVVLAGEDGLPPEVTLRSTTGKNHAGRAPTAISGALSARVRGGEVQLQCAGRLGIFIIGVCPAPGSNSTRAPGTSR